MTTKEAPMRTIVLTTLAALAVPLAVAAAPAQKPLSGNLVKNPGAEAGPATPDSAQAALPVPSWTVTGGFHAASYAGYRWAPDPRDKTKGSGAKFFVGCFAAPGETVNRGTATQTISIARLAKAIDTGGVQLRLSAELGGYDGTENMATAAAAFLDSNGKRLGKTIGVKGPTYLQRQGVTRVEPRTKTGAVPAGARSVQVTLTGSRTGSGPCGFVDNVSAVLLPVTR
jgi:hypothetical protein